MPFLPKRTVTVGDRFSLAMPGADKPLRTVFEASAEDVGERILWMPDGDDLPLTIVPRAEPRPAGFLPSGGDLKSAVAKGGTVLLERGGTYRPGSIRITQDNTKIAAIGDPSQPMPRVAGYIECDDRKGLTIEGIYFDGTNIPQTGIRCYNTDRIRIADTRVENFDDYGIRIQGKDGHRCESVALQGVVVANNAGGGKESGVLFRDVHDWTLQGCVFDTNGWRPGKFASTIYNHNVYIHASCSPGAVLDNVFHNASSHGIQQRSGGDCRGNVFINNPIHLSYGYVNGNPVFNGGVSGEVSGNVYIGSRDISSGETAGKRGWAMEFGNIKSVRVFDTLIAHDTQNNEQAILVARCRDVEGPAKDIGVQSLTIERIYCWAWPKGAIDVKDGLKVVATDRVGIAPPVIGDLRVALGAAFMDFARANPSDAAKEAVKRCRAAVGL